jgi:hypothetical protein
MKFMKAFLGWVRRKAVVLLIYGTLLLATTCLYLYKINVLIPGLNEYEAQIVERVAVYEYPWRISVDAPYITVVKLAEVVGVDPLLGARILSALLMVLSVLFILLFVT